MSDRNGKIFCTSIASLSHISKKTRGRLVLGAGSLYGAIESLCKKGWIYLYDDSDVRKKQYLITDLGKEVAQRERERIQELLNVSNEIMGGIEQ